jgi:serine/threonine protein kinase
MGILRFPFGNRSRQPDDGTLVSSPAALAEGPATLQAGPYVLESQLSAGGESHIWLARHSTAGTPAVVKVQRADVVPLRLRRETAILYALQMVRTPNVVRLLPAGADGAISHQPGRMRLPSGEDLLYCAIERLPCEGPENVIGKGPLRGRDALAVSEALRTALRTMHLDFGMIHNDLKPGNVVAWRDPRDGQLQVRLFDFGQAALLMPHRLSRHPCVTPEPATRYVYRYGSLLYMAPERWRGRETGDGSDRWLMAAIVDDRSDQWSFAALLFELMTGRKLVDGRTEEQIRRTILGGAYLAVVDEARLAPAVKQPLKRALALDAAARYQRQASVSGLDFLCRDLEAALA